MVLLCNVNLKRAKKEEPLIDLRNLDQFIGAYDSVSFVDGDLFRGCYFIIVFIKQRNN
ncbi:MAG: hypothetical protein ACI85S_002882 [Pseudohongiellaceae bacterium]|jgi:hypothetical protein